MDGVQGRVRADSATSVQRRLSLWLSVIIIGVAVLAGGFAFVSAFSEAHELQDDVLRQVGAMFDPEHLPAMPGTVADMPHMADEESRVTVQLLAPPGTGPAMAALPHMPAFPATLQDGMQTATVGKRDYLGAQTRRDP